MKPVFQFVVLVFFFASCGSNNSSESNLDDRERELIRREAKIEAQEELNAQKQDASEANLNAASETDEKRPERVQEEKAPSMNYFARGAGRYPFTSERLIDYRDVRNLSTWDLTVMRNEIFARHGYIFRKNEDVIRYFNNQPWYRPVSDEVELSDIEKANIHFIKSLEQSAG